MPPDVPTSRGSVHPHVRGDDPTSARSRQNATGSPPRAWGRFHVPFPLIPRSRFTPTCVGTMIRSPACTIRSIGSPPRAWGRLCPPSGTPTLTRFTPTCVGTIPGNPRTRPANTVHPHVRGDDACLSPCSGVGCGSPPRAWGRLKRPRVFRRGHRFTPTCVGTMSRVRPHTPGRPVHPHVRGDDGGDIGLLERRVRFTPTCVGTIACVDYHAPRRTVHPHVRGDDPDSGDPASRAGGSPPRAWGRCGMLVAHATLLRFTPTCVGTMARGSAPNSAAPVHPHVRGDDDRRIQEPPYAPGSPPRAWGRSTCKQTPRRPGRFTPTCVGTMPRLGGTGYTEPVHPHVRGDDVWPTRSGLSPGGSPPRAWGRW